VSIAENLFYVCSREKKRSGEYCKKSYCVCPREMERRVCRKCSLPNEWRQTVGSGSNISSSDKGKCDQCFVLRLKTTLAKF